MKSLDILKQENKRLEDLMKQTTANPEKIIYDGVYDEFLENYSTAKPRILWILKEAPEDNDQYGWHVGDIKEGNKALKKQGGTLRQICLISNAVLHRCNYEEANTASEKDLVDTRQKVAQINISKIKITTGKYSATDMTTEYNKWKAVLKEQIKVYEPEIIICGNTLQYFSNDNNYFETTKNKKVLIESIFPNFQKKYCYYRENNKLIINIHHPSDWKVNWKKCVDEIAKITNETG